MEVRPKAFYSNIKFKFIASRHRIRRGGQMYVLLVKHQTCRIVRLSVTPQSLTGVNRYVYFPVLGLQPTLNRRIRTYTY